MHFAVLSTGRNWGSVSEELRAASDMNQEVVAGKWLELRGQVKIIACGREQARRKAGQLLRLV